MSTISIDDVISKQERSHVVDDISMLAKHGLVSESSRDTVVKKSQRVQNSGLPMFEESTVDSGLPHF